VVVADHQTAGRGRLDRSWTAPPGSSLLLSILMRPDLAPADAHLAVTAVAIAAVEACTATAGVAPSIKWPNDLMLVAPDGEGRGKVAGILAESIIERNELSAVVVGIGLNVNWPDTLPDELKGIAVALNHATGRHVDREGLLIALLQSLSRWRARLDNDDGRAELLVSYRASCATLGTHVKVQTSDGAFAGQAIDITREGHLEVQPDDGGPPRVVIAGDVVHLRAG
jgi:BirA family biotin operon repressor/biotin-[acetyl-CoA-carboxylase] ligase